MDWWHLDFADDTMAGMNTRGQKTDYSRPNIKGHMNRRAFVIAIAVIPMWFAPSGTSGEDAPESSDRIRIACVGDSITYGARLTDRAKGSYPAQLQKLLGDGVEVTNFGVGSCTLIRKGRPNVWSQLGKIQRSHPDVVIVSLGTNDTCGGRRRCWDHKDEFPADCRDLIDALRAFPSRPSVWLCAPTPMVLETPGLSPKRIADLRTRKPRLKELIGVVKAVATEKQVGLIDLNTPLANRPDWFTKADGVHPNQAGYLAVAELVAKALRDSPELSTEESAQAGSQ
jgi:sialate O-acetylesterase